MHTTPAQAPLAHTPRLEEWLASNTTGWHSAAQPAPTTRPAPGHVYAGWAGQRPPYGRSPALVLTDAHSLSAAALAHLLSLPISASSANTSALEGLVSKLSAMARAVRNRSYVVMAASISDSGVLDDLRSNSSLRSKASVASFTGIGSVSIVEIDHCDGAQADGATDGGALNYPQAATVSGFQLEEETHTDEAYQTGPLIWVGAEYGGDGKWLTNAEALALADALRAMAEAQTARLAKEGGAA